MDRYQNVEKPRPEVPIHENEIRITSQGLVRNYISYATGLLQDESDEMLSRGFKYQIYDVYRYLPPELQVVLISVTLPNEILEMSKSMTDPVRILVKRDGLTLEGIKRSSLQ
ncbi:hypothetical protein RHGRI_014674 [Rhododendron griersonianum]|uniref:Uncharacterized protein n=1 Tax=Rhododendron griersonianum TaxID=479676 RepID=A0AAV6KA89_9ERIC|nr:hypothetical protein RHGRI_014674 [Rhododendron griersonianum]KAG5549407.1 hypothetical protein RHGRI_014674 [Rhododendron griersonianum]